MNLTEAQEYDTLFVVQSMFYMLLPSQTYFKTVGETPNIVAKVTNQNVFMFKRCIFFNIFYQASGVVAAFLLIEIFVLIIKDGLSSIRVNDRLTSFCSGLLMRSPE